MLVKVYRFDPSLEKEGRFQEFDVPVKEHWTVMDILDYITTYCDHSLAYFKHSACDHGICGRCALKVNGKVKLACTCAVESEPKLVLEPKSEKIGLTINRRQWCPVVLLGRRVLRIVSEKQDFLLFVLTIVTLAFRQNLMKLEFRMLWLQSKSLWKARMLQQHIP